MEVEPRRWFCVCGYNVKDESLYDRRAALNRHHESGEHERMTKVNAIREGMSQVDAAVEREIERRGDE